MLNLKNFKIMAYSDDYYEKMELLAIPQPTAEEVEKIELLEAELRAQDAELYSADENVPYEEDTHKAVFI